MNSAKSVSILDFIGHTNIYLAVAAAVTSYVSLKLINAPSDITVPMIAFLVTFSIYNFNRKTDVEEDAINYPERLKFFRRYGNYSIGAAIACYLFAIFLASFKGLVTVLVVLIPLILGIVYSVRWVPRRLSEEIGFSRLKERAYTKDFIVALGWASGMAFVPMSYFSMGITSAVLALFFFIFLRVFITTVVFDMRDIKGDGERGINSIPIAIGFHRSRLLAALLNTVSASLVIVAVFNGWLPPLTLFINLISIYCFAYLYLFPRYESKFFYDFIVDGEYIVIGILAWMGTLIV